MRISLDDITIHAPTHPTRAWSLNDRDWEDYRAEGFLKDIPVGHVTISRGLNCTGRYDDIFFLDTSENPPIPKPYVSFQKTEEQFRGHGICGRLILLSNEFYRGKLGTTLYSDTHFVISFREQSKQVWRKLQAQSLAIFEPYVRETGEQQDRWFVL